MLLRHRLLLCPTISGQARQRRQIAPARHSSSEPGGCRQDRHADLRPGETTKTITITVNGDSKKEADETFYLDLFGNSSNSLFTKSRGLGTILNDD
jgi:hypothetical protein